MFLPTFSTNTWKNRRASLCVVLGRLGITDAPFAQRRVKRRERFPDLTSSYPVDEADKFENVAGNSVRKCIPVGRQMCPPGPLMKHCVECVERNGSNLE